MINRNCFYTDTGCWESPRTLSEFALVPGVLVALARLQAAGYLLFLVSNQPNLAKRKTSPGEFRRMHRAMLEECRAAGVVFTRTLYCFHHPAVTGPCLCRKPSPHLLHRAAVGHELSLSDSWIFGDRVTDLECGRAARVRTAWIDTGEREAPPDRSLYDLRASSLAAAAALLTD